MDGFKSIVNKLNGHEVTNKRVLMNIDILTRLSRGPIIGRLEYDQFTAVKFLNRKGLLKYRQREKENDVVVYPTLLFYYLTLAMKYDIYKVYKESIKLYQLVGDKLNDVKYL